MEIVKIIIQILPVIIRLLHTVFQDFGLIILCILLIAGVVTGAFISVKSFMNVYGITIGKKAKPIDINEVKL